MDLREFAEGQRLAFGKPMVFRQSSRQGLAEELFGNEFLAANWQRQHDDINVPTVQPIELSRHCACPLRAALSCRIGASPGVPRRKCPEGIDLPSRSCRIGVISSTTLIVQQKCAFL